MRPLSVAAILLGFVIVLAATILFLRFVRGVEVAQCMTLSGHQARVECFRQFTVERSRHAF